MENKKSGRGLMLVELIEKELGGTVTKAILTKDNREFEL